MECLFVGSDDESYLSEETESEKIDSIGSVSKKADSDAKKKSKSKVGVGEGYVAAEAKKVAYKVWKHLSVDSDENDQPEKTGDEEIDSVDSRNIMAGCDANKMKSTSKSGFGEADVAATPKKVASKVRRHVSFVEREASPSSSDGSTGDSDDSDFEVEKSNFSVDANKSNASESKGNALGVSFYTSLITYAKHG